MIGHQIWCKTWTYRYASTATRRVLCSFRFLMFFVCFIALLLVVSFVCLHVSHWALLTYQVCLLYCYRFMSSIPTISSFAVHLRVEARRQWWWWVWFTFRLWAVAWWVICSSCVLLFSCCWCIQGASVKLYRDENCSLSAVTLFCYLFIGTYICNIFYLSQDHTACKVASYFVEFATGL